MAAEKKAKEDAFVLQISEKVKTLMDVKVTQTNEIKYKYVDRINRKEIRTLRHNVRAAVRSFLQNQEMRDE